MNSRTMRRLAADHGALHTQPLPPNYLFGPATSDDDLTQLDLLLAGPTHTPFATGVWKLHLTIPPDYPQRPPTANFRTPIFHPNVEPQTGGVCVETLKRDWDLKLTLRDVLVTISCLLIQPNPDSALNAEAGSLIQENYEAFARRAALMTSIHAVVPKELRGDVTEAQMRGQEAKSRTEDEVKDEADIPAAPARRRRMVTARQRGAAVGRRSDGSPTGGAGRRRQHAELSNPFVTQSRNDDVFDSSIQPREEPSISQDDDSSIMIDADQENDETRSPTKGKATKTGTPRRPPGAPVPLGELTIEDAQPDTSDDDSTEAEYPPSPKKNSSPTKSPSKRRPLAPEPAQSSRDAAVRGNVPNVTPPNNLFAQPLARDSPLNLADPATSPRKARILQETPKRAPLFPSLSTQREYAGVFKARSPSSAEKKAEEKRKRVEMEEKLWEACGRDIRRWNRGDFEGEPFVVKARRW